MSDDVIALLAVMHSRCRRMVFDARDAHAQGLQSAVRPLRGRVPAWLSRRLVQLDIACAFNRHATRSSYDDMIAALQCALDGLHCDAQGDAAHDGSAFFGVAQAQRPHVGAPVALGLPGAARAQKEQDGAALRCGLRGSARLVLLPGATIVLIGLTMVLARFTIHHGAHGGAHACLDGAHEPVARAHAARELGVAPC